VLSHCGPHGLIVLIKLVSDAVLVGDRERSYGQTDDEGHEFTHFETMKDFVQDVSCRGSNSVRGETWSKSECEGPTWCCA
jgi:hypothetical protein